MAHRPLEADSEPPSPPSAELSSSLPSPATEKRKGVLAAVPLRPPRFPVAGARRRFYAAHFPGSGPEEWNDWRWQMRRRIRSLDALERIFALSDSEREAVRRAGSLLPVGITPYYAALMDPFDPTEPLRRTHIPTLGEYLRSPGEADDPLGEDHDTVAPGLVHRYPDRVLFLVTGTCSTYCRYCTRSRMVGKPGGEYGFSHAGWEAALNYIAAHPEIRDVLLSGGDPLTLSDERLDYLLGRLRRIRHVEFIRIGTKVPMVLPMRITRELVRVLRRHRPVWMSVHATHPRELTPECEEAFARLADAGVPLGSQTVLLKGVNDEVETMRALFHGLLKVRVRPYYLYQCDPISGSAHFRTPVEKGLEIIAGLRGFTTGYAVPHYVIDAPGGGGKIALLPDAVAGRDGDDLLLRNYEGRIFRYPDPAGGAASGTAATGGGDAHRPHL